MYRLFSLSALYFLIASAEPRTPKIYNVLISSKKNLSPSHALPVYEPVLRTTSLGIALPPIFYHSPLIDYQPPAAFGPNFITATAPQILHENAPQTQDAKDNNDHGGTPQQQQVPLERFIPYGYTQLANNQNYYNPVPQENDANARTQFLANNPGEQYYQKSEDPKTIIANLKRNPNIPDVPPPALPVRTNTS